MPLAYCVPLPSTYPLLHSVSSECSAHGHPAGIPAHQKVPTDHTPVEIHHTCPHLRKNCAPHPSDAPVHNRFPVTHPQIHIFLLSEPHKKILSDRKSALFSVQIHIFPLVLAHTDTLHFPKTIFSSFSRKMYFALPANNALSRL